MRLTTNFSLAEFTASQTAARRGIDNDLPAALLGNARATAEMLERIREFLSKHLGRPAPILLTSGYRSPALNAAVGGSLNSDHARAQAADWHCPAVGRPVEVCRLLAPHIDSLGIGQIINEFPGAAGGWIHTSIARPAREVNRVITIARSGTFPGILEVA